MYRKLHWEEVYRQKPENSVSWFELRPEISLELIQAAGLQKTDALIDVGGGSSRLADHLLAEGFADLSVLDDIAEPALEKAKTRLGASALRVHWIVADITRWQPPRTYRLWHDRAMFHFLTDPAERAAYRNTLQAALPDGGTAIIASFSPAGPERCSGLPVQRCSPQSLAAELGPRFALREWRESAHVTPAGKTQLFQYSMFVRV
ncbi:MAG: methyltransferase domain-containing protein [Gammaproteobacteria bacterium]|nr:methyltransferase domain-containing protein [Gammaproteobacteria bacterium]MDE2023019.1 class I SAM-dependent methyltransferase [Gammaproteobacteria bacterium]